MPNIIINSYCNQKCPYCFAQDMMSGGHTNITLKEFKKIFQWLKKSECHHIGLIGGEPTLNPHLKDILMYINEEKKTYALRITIFTNGTNLKPIMPYVDGSYQFLININAPEHIGEDNAKKTIKGLELLKERPEIKTVFGATIFPGIENVEYILKLANEYNKPYIRVSYAAPNAPEGVDKHQYYADGKEIFYDFAMKCAAHGVKLWLDCNRIPVCHYTQEEYNVIKLLLENANTVKNYCFPVIDIDKNGDATACFGGGNGLKPKNIFDFEDYGTLERNFYCNDMTQKALHNDAGKCKDCDAFKRMHCQGGCLAFSSYSNKENI